jgi:hypothetical protein
LSSSPTQDARDAENKWRDITLSNAQMQEKWERGEKEKSPAHWQD